MSGDVPFSEAAAVLAWIVQAPGQVRALRPFDAATYGPLPFFVFYPAAEAEAEVTLSFAGGVITGLTSVRIGRRFSNAEDWAAEGDPFDTLGEAMQAVLEATLRTAADALS